MHFTLFTVLTLPVVALAECAKTDEVCQLTSLGWKPAAASYIASVAHRVGAGVGPHYIFDSDRRSTITISPSASSTAHSTTSGTRNGTSVATSERRNATTTAAPSVTVIDLGPFSTVIDAASRSVTWASIVNNFGTDQVVGPAQYSSANQVLATVATDPLVNIKPAQSVVSQALSLQNDAGPEAKPTDAAFMAMMGAAAAAGVGLVL